MPLKRYHYVINIGIASNFYATVELCLCWSLCQSARGSIVADELWGIWIVPSP